MYSVNDVNALNFDTTALKLMCCAVCAPLKCTVYIAYIRIRTIFTSRLCFVYDVYYSE